MMNKVILKTDFSFKFCFCSFLTIFSSSSSLPSSVPPLPSTSTVLKATNSSGANRERVSDPHIWHEIQDWEAPQSNVTLPSGKPESIETDIPGPPLSPDDFQRGQIMVFDPIDTSVQLDPIEFAGLYEGDIDIRGMNSTDLPIKDFSSSWQNRIDDYSEGMLKTSLSSTRDFEKKPKLLYGPRSAITDINRLWPNGVVPYLISNNYNERERAAIAKAMTQFHENTCINFVPRIIEKDYIHILKGDGCSSSVGKIGGAQQLSLGLGCVNLGIVMHEMMHALGFWHEQSRADREKHIEIIWPNIQNGMKYNFQKYDEGVIQNLGSYDTGSVMHYGPYAFSKNRKRPTIIAKNGGEIGQRRGFSKIDVLKIKELYKCDSPFPTTEASSVTATAESCEDMHKFCQDWGKKGECEANTLWMQVFCRKSCNKCNEKCGDLSQFCEFWSKQEECKKNPNYMHYFCKMSCGLCHEEGPSADCKDMNTYCSAWAESGQCHINQEYMLLYCKQSCKKC